MQPGNFYAEIYDGIVCLQMLFCFGQRQQIFSVVFLWNKKVPVEQVNFHIIRSDMEKSFTKAGLL